MTTRRNGISLIWSIVTLTAMCAIASLAVDFGRVAVAKSQLRAAADAAALAAGQWVLSDTAAARNVAASTAKLNKADGKEVVLIHVVPLSRRSLPNDPANRAGVLFHRGVRVPHATMSRCQSPR